MLNYQRVGALWGDYKIILESLSELLKNTTASYPTSERIQKFNALMVVGSNMMKQL